MNRGEIWTVSGGVYASKSRPALIIQDDRYDATDSVEVLVQLGEGLLDRSEELILGSGNSHWRPGSAHAESSCLHVGSPVHTTTM